MDDVIGPDVGNGEVAATILEQLGGRRFIAMTGATHLLAEQRALRMHLPANFARDGINRVRIELTALDLYDLTFSRVAGMKVLYESSITDIDCCQLHDAFEQETGLFLRL